MGKLSSVMEEIVMNFEKQGFPEYVEFQTYSKCNAYCTICPYKNLDDKKTSRKMKDSCIEKIINECDRNKLKIKRIIPYMNNEPTLDKRLLNILRRLKKMGHFVELSTNFSGMNEDLMNKIIEEKLIDDLRISFFGGNKYFYSKLMPQLNFNINYNKIRKFIEINKKFGNPINYKIISVLCPWINMEENIYLLKNIFFESKIHVFGYLDRAGNVKEYKNNTIYFEDKKQKLCGCELERPFERITILADGNVILCSQDWNEEIIIGNILNNSIEKIWNSDRFEKIRNIIRGIENTNENFICYKCKLAKLCYDNKRISNFNGDKYMSPKGEKKIY